MSKEYIVPSWAGKPQDDFYFEILKDGVIIGKIDLSRESFSDKTYKIIGRQADIVDIAMEHPSLSRQHAVLQFRDDGALMVLDWKSAQGTTLNKEKLNPDNYYRVYVGSMLRFGASSRLHILCGPDSHLQPEYDSANMQLYREKLQHKNLEDKKKVEESNFISWGIGEDAPEEEDSDNENIPEYLKNDENYDRKYGKVYHSNINENDISEKHPKLYEKIKKNEKKIQNMQDENKKIYLKENNQENGLTEGQLSTVQRNDERIALLIQENEELMFQINGLSTKRIDVTKVKEKRKHDSDDDDNDENLYDTTKQTIDINNNWRLKKKNKNNIQISQNNSINYKNSLSYDELINEKEKFINLLNDNRIKLNDIETKLCELSQIPENENDKDDIDDVINNNKEKDLLNELKLLKSNDIEINKSIQKFDRLISITKTSLTYLSNDK